VEQLYFASLWDQRQLEQEAMVAASMLEFWARAVFLGGGDEWYRRPGCVRLVNALVKAAFILAKAPLLKVFFAPERPVGPAPRGRPGRGGGGDPEAAGGGGGGGRGSGSAGAHPRACARTHAQALLQEQHAAFLARIELAKQKSKAGAFCTRSDERAARRC
jgi:uncharacterized membrane protein YgcG